MSQKIQKSFLKDKNAIDKLKNMNIIKSVLNDTAKKIKKGIKFMLKARLEYEMNIRGISKGQICERLGISRSAFYRKCNGISEFTHSEMVKIVEILKLDNPKEIFFN